MQLDLEPGDYREKGSREPVFRPGGLGRLLYAAIMFTVLWALYLAVAFGVDQVFNTFWPD